MRLGFKFKMLLLVFALKVSNNYILCVYAFAYTYRCVQRHMYLKPSVNNTFGCIYFVNSCDLNIFL